MGHTCSKSNSSGELEERDIELMMENTSFTRQQIKDWHSSFISDCPKGQLSRKKFIEVYKEFYPHGKAEKFCEHVFRTFDQNKNNHIDFNEFLLALNVTSSKNLQKKLDLAFTMYDIDGNGKIDRREMKKIIKAVYELLGDSESSISVDSTIDKQVNETFKKFDENKDNLLSREEFIQGCLQDDFVVKLLTPKENLI